MRKIKILFEGLSSNIGGIETYIYNLYKNMDKEKFEIFFLVQKRIKIAFEENYKKDNIVFFRIEDRKKNYFKYLNELKELYQSNDFDFIHINIMSYSLFERITYACKYSNAKVIIHSHNGGFTKNSKYKKTIFLDKIGRMFVRKYENDIIRVACGEKAGRFAFKNRDFEIFNNGINIDTFLFNNNIRLKLRKQFNFNDSNFLLLLVGMFNDQKNHSFLIDILNEYLKLDKNARLILVGEGYLKEKIQAKVKSLKIEDFVYFLGKKDNVNEILSMCDVFVMPSLYEGLSIALVEAQVNGLKCYTSDEVDEKSNVTGNVEFLSLQKSAKEWAKYIFNSSNTRDNEVVNKVPDEFNAKKSYQRVFQYYIDNL